MASTVIVNGPSTATRLPARPAASRAHTVAIPGQPDLIGTFMGRDALTLAMRQLRITTDDVVLLPAYTCQEVLRSFMKKAKVVFYDVGSDLAIDPDALRRQLASRRVRMVLTTDYFGFRQPHRLAIKRACADAGAWLVEDCAHSLLTDGAGDTGDLAIYSFRKIVPVHDGGGLRVNRAFDATSGPHFRPRLYSNALSLVAQAKSGLNIHTAMLSRARVESHTTEALSSPVNADERVMPLSMFAARRMTRIPFADVAAMRRRDFLFWLDECRDNRAVRPVFRELPPGVCPVGIPVRVRNRSALERRARQADIVLSVHWRLERDIGEECATSHALSAELLTLPVAPDIDTERRDRLARLLREDWRDA
jgi:perosamine synthetase